VTLISLNKNCIGGKIAEEGRFKSVWWNNLISVKNGVGVGGGRWFDDNVGREVGDGAQTFFLVGSLD
jgi:hypothetical protein